MPKHFARSALLILDAARWNIDWEAAPFTSMRFSTILKWTPDESNHCGPLAEVFAPEVSPRFAMNPLLVSLASAASCRKRTSPLCDGRPSGSS